MGRKVVIKSTFLDYPLAEVLQALWDFMTKAVCRALVKRNLWFIQYI